MEKQPKVSVIIPSYNYEKYIEETIDSVRNQSEKNIEIIIVDDGSSDNSLPLIQKIALKDKRIKVLTHHNHQNKGLSESLKLALKHSTGDRIAFLESDDFWPPDSLENRLRILEATGADIIYGDIELIIEEDADPKWFSAVISNIREKGLRLSSNGKVSFSLKADFLMENQIATFSTILLRKEVLLSLDWSSPVPKWLDWWLWTQASLSFTFSYCPRVSAYWRIHKGSYNSKVSLTSYMRNGKDMWKGFREVVGPKYKNQKLMNWYYFLQCPFFMRLFLRSLIILKKDGVTKGLERIARRIR